ncbi:unnamed protein product [Tenebrio molitor]|nr:unnamed protein product [Tenebrio molitor]
MLLLEGYISNFTRARYYFLCVEFSDFYVNQSLAGQTIVIVESAISTLSLETCQ